MNEVLKAIKERRSIRKYKSDMLPKEIIDQVIESGLYAASGKGQQSPIIISVTNKELRDKLSRIVKLEDGKKVLIHFLMHLLY